MSPSPQSPQPPSTPPSSNPPPNPQPSVTPPGQIPPVITGPDFASNRFTQVPGWKGTIRVNGSADDGVFKADYSIVGKAILIDQTAIDANNNIHLSWPTAPLGTSPADAIPLLRVWDTRVEYHSVATSPGHTTTCSFSGTVKYNATLALATDSNNRLVHYQLVLEDLNQPLTVRCIDTGSGAYDEQVNLGAHSEVRKQIQPLPATGLTLSDTRSYNFPEDDLHVTVDWGFDPVP
ncbi:MAG: hypothetical protein ACAI44_00740 [Candidatus Sericytochromatia bacterium]